MVKEKYDKNLKSNCGEIQKNYLWQLIQVFTFLAKNSSLFSLADFKMGLSVKTISKIL